MNLRLNGKLVSVPAIDRATPLLYILRNDFGLQGPKFGCGLGQCGAGTRSAEISLAWLQALGVSLIAVTGPESTDVFHDYNHPGKFEGALREKWRDGGDVIYEVPQRTRELVHVVERGELVKHYPASLVDIDALRR